MAKYKKRPDGRYYTTVGTGHIDPLTGKEERIPVYGKTLAEFEGNRTKIKYELAHGMYADDKGYTVGTYSWKWLETYKAHTEDNTYAGYKNIVKNHLKPIEQIPLKDLTKTDVQTCINKQTGHWDIQRRIRLTLNQMLETAIDDQLVYKNVCRKVQIGRKPKTSKRALCDYEKKAIEKAYLTPKERAFVNVLYYTGMRREEVLALIRTDFDFKTESIHVQRAISFVNNQPKVKDVKSTAGERWLDMFEPFTGDMKNFVDSLDTLYLFTRKDGSPMSRTSYMAFWEGIILKINEAAGGKNVKVKVKSANPNAKKKYRYVWKRAIDAVPGLTPHIFRHNFATNLYYSEVDLKEAVRIMGHADAKMLIETYAHLDKQKSNSKNKISAYYAAM